MSPISLSACRYLAIALFSDLRSFLLRSTVMTG